jgi:ubiquinone/menaquinone biosynthesis C-methylase UbiE
MKDTKRTLRRQDLHFLPKQKIVLNDFSAEGYILDIGGGGEGVIGQLKGKQVVAIDSNPFELIEATDGPLKILMDARELKFLDNTFNLVTAFYCLMYMTEQDHKQVFGEVFRVLKDEGLFRIWDVQLTSQDNICKPGFAIPLEINLPDKMINIGYGWYWPEVNYDMDYYTKLSEQVGFTIIQKSLVKSSISLVLRKQ